MIGGLDRRAWEARCSGWRIGTQESIEAIGHAFHLLYLTIFDGSKLEDTTVSRRQKSGGVGAKWPDPRLERTVEEGGEVGVYMEVWFSDLGKARLSDQL